MTTTDIALLVWRDGTFFKGRAWVRGSPLGVRSCFTGGGYRET